MDMTVRQRADWITTFRFISIHLMETLARWVPTTAEMEVKLLFGRHLWDFAQHADAFGKRAAALRVAQHTSRPPAGEFQRALDRFAGAVSAADRVDALYDGLIPSLSGIYEKYVDQADHLMDETSVRILERAMADLERMRREREALREERPDIVAEDRAFVDEIGSLIASAEVVDYRPDPPKRKVAR